MLEPDSIIGDLYRIKRLIARGGMGYVYQAERIDAPDFTVAVKVLDSKRLTVTNDREVFRNEVLAGYRVQHQNVVRIYEYFDKPTEQAYAMEYLAGGDLLARTGKPLPVQEALRILAQISNGLAALHRSGTLHRDVKPENILFAADGTVKITDFGVAKVRGGRDLTPSGLLAGTPKYLAPEYVEGGKVDHRADIYALGVIGFELLTGESPFKATREEELLKERLGEVNFDLRILQPNTRSEVAEIIMKLAARTPAARFYDASDAAQAIENLFDPNSSNRSSPAARVSWIDQLRSLEAAPVELDEHPKREDKSMPKRRWSSLELVAAGLIVALIVATAFPLFESM